MTKAERRLLIEIASAQGTQMSALMVIATGLFSETPQLKEMIEAMEKHNLALVAALLSVGEEK